MCYSSVHAIAFIAMYERIVRQNPKCCWCQCNHVCHALICSGRLSELWKLVHLSEPVRCSFVATSAAVNNSLPALQVLIVSERRPTTDGFERKKAAPSRRFAGRVWTNCLLGRPVTHVTKSVLLGVFTWSVYCECLPGVFTESVYWVFAGSVYRECLLSVFIECLQAVFTGNVYWKNLQGVLTGSVYWECLLGVLTMSVCCEYLLGVFTENVYCECLPGVFTESAYLSVCSQCLQGVFTESVYLECLLRVFIEFFAGNAYRECLLREFIGSVYWRLMSW